MHILSIAGSDPSSGAGIQGDARTFSFLGVYPLTVITVLTSQNTSKFFGVKPVSPSMVKSQIRSLLSDFQIDAIKIGMVYNKQIIKAIHSELKDSKIPIVLDPVFESTTGGALLRDDAFMDFKKLLIPMAYVITPNVLEAERIANMKIHSLNELKKAASKIHQMGAKRVVIKGGHLPGNKAIDLLLDEHKFHTFSQKKIKIESHGGGCAFSAALCVCIARKKNLIDAIKFSQEFTVRSIKNAKKIGRGLSIVRQKTSDSIEDDLSQAISNFTNLDGIDAYIPECQTNFVYSKPHPVSLLDILGLEGRIVRTGNSVIIAGNLKYGGSKHVATAVIEMNKKFPSVRSALNIRYDKRTIEKAVARRFGVSHYDRNLESRRIKDKEGKTISWGIKSAIKKSKNPPDLIYHLGDVGKEPMILIFGNTPTEVLAKLVKIRR